MPNTLVSRLKRQRTILHTNHIKIVGFGDTATNGTMDQFAHGVLGISFFRLCGDK